jgi:hypothetical protein
MGPHAADANVTIRVLSGLAGIFLLMSLGACSAGAVAGAAVGTASFAARTTVKAGAAAVRVTGRVGRATVRTISGGGAR